MVQSISGKTSVHNFIRGGNLVSTVQVTFRGTSTTVMTVFVTILLMRLVDRQRRF